MTGFPRAVALTTGTSLLVVDYLPLHQDVTADSTGTATATFDQVEQGYIWLVTAGSVRTNSATDTRAIVWAGPRFMDGSDSGNFDATDRNSPILVAAGEQLQIVWSGATPGAVCTFDGQYQLVLKG